MSTNVQKYVDFCLTCRRTKAKRHLPYEKLQPLPIPTGPQKDWTLDFITDLPLSVCQGQVFDSILVVIDRYTKFSLYILSRKDWDAENLANALVEKIFTKYGKPFSFVSDLGSLFTLNFWSALCYYLGICLGYSTAFHHQTDWQTERQNQTLKQYLCGFVNYQQNDWVFLVASHCILVQQQRSCVNGDKPFQGAFWGKAKLGWRGAEETKYQSACCTERAVNLLAMQQNLEKRLAKAVALQAKYYDLKHFPRTFAVGDFVYLNSKNIDSTRPSKKLDWKYYSPYQIQDRIGKIAYWLVLPKAMKIHNVFHVFLLEPCKLLIEDTIPLPPPIEVNGEEEYEVKKILNSRVRHRKLQYLIKWLGYPDSNNEWVPKGHIAGSKELVDLFHRLYPEKPNSRAWLHSSLQFVDKQLTSNVTVNYEYIRGITINHNSRGGHEIITELKEFIKTI